MAGFIRMYLLSIVLWLPASVGIAAVEQDKSKEEPPPAQQETKQNGQAEFDRVCKVCHGPEARGDAGPPLVPFTREYEELLGIVREGAGQMPPISARQLPDEGVAQIVVYLKSLSQER
jgi:mono/diheme cytochrome c family protein